jgi:hypothetical protein
MRKHTLEATKGQTYVQMGRYVDANGKPTNDEKSAAKDPKTGAPTANPARHICVTETALTTALNTAYFAESTAMFVIVMGGALVLVAIGFLVLIVVATRSTTLSEPEKDDSEKNTIKLAAERHRRVRPEPSLRRTSRRGLSSFAKRGA